MDIKFQTFKHFRGALNEEVIEITPQNAPGAVSIPKKLPDEVSIMLIQRLCDEYAAHYNYRNAANWCKNMNFKKAATYFEAEAASELDHAKMLQDYLTQWNVMPIIPEVKTDTKFTGLVHIIDESYDIEYNLLQKYSEHQKMLMNLHPATHNFIQGMVDIQNQSVAEYSDLLNALYLINVNNKLDLLYFEQTYF
jgi:ferritin